MSSVLIRRSFALLAAAGLAASLAGAALAQSIPDKEINRDLVRRALLDTCVYAEAGKEGAKKDKVADACQCASFKAMKGVKEEEVAAVAASRTIPDAWYAATTTAYGTCTR